MKIRLGTRGSMPALAQSESDDPAAVSELVRELRGTESRRSAGHYTPILTGIHRPIEETTRLLGAE